MTPSRRSTTPRLLRPTVNLMGDRMSGSRRFVARRRCRPPRPLSQRTGNAGESQIACRRWPAGRLPDDVIDVKNGFLSRLRQPTILATIAGPAHDLSPQPGGDGGHCAMRSARRRSSVKNSARLTKPSASARSTAVSGWPESCRSRRACKCDSNGLWQAKAGQFVGKINFESKRHRKLRLKCCIILPPILDSTTNPKTCNVEPSGVVVQQVSAVALNGEQHTDHRQKVIQCGYYQHLL